MKLVKIPSSQGGLGMSAGAEKAPAEIVKRLKDIYLSEDGILPNFEVDEVNVISNDLEETNKNIYEKAKKELRDSQKVIFLGGDHSIMFPIAKAFSEVYGNAGIIMFDAHPDCVNEFLPATQEDIVTSLVNQRIIKPENIILVAIRSIHPIELKYLRDKRIKNYTMKEIAREGIHAVCDAVMAAAKDFGALYLSVDIDAVDPAFAPGTGWPEPAGLTSRELIYFLQRIKLLKNFKAADLSEISPDKDINGMTSKLGAKIVAELG